MPKHRVHAVLSWAWVIGLSVTIVVIYLLVGARPPVALLYQALTAHAHPHVTHTQPTPCLGLHPYLDYKREELVSRHAHQQE